MVFDLADDLAQIWPEFRIGQVKEKFGGLRFYPESYKTDYEGQPLSESKMYQLIAAAEDKSYKICEICGDPGKEKNNGWIQTLCDKHAQEKA